MEVPYVELHAHSVFSFLDGASTPLELAAAAADLGYPAFALTDHDGVWGSMEFVQACKGFGMRAITGAEVTVRVGRPAGPVAAGEPPPAVAKASSGAVPPTAPPAGRYVHLTLLCESAVGYRNLSRLLTEAHSRTRDNAQRSAERPWVSLGRVEELAEGLVCLSGCAGEGAVASAFERGEEAEGADLYPEERRCHLRDRRRQSHFRLARNKAGDLRR